jgi:hypothetical protein
MNSWFTLKAHSLTFYSVIFVSIILVCRHFFIEIILPPKIVYFTYCDCEGFNNKRKEMRRSLNMISRTNFRFNYMSSLFHIDNSSPKEFDSLYFTYCDSEGFNIK